MLVDSNGDMVGGTCSTDPSHGGLHGHRRRKRHGEEAGENQVEAGMKHGQADGPRSSKTRKQDVARGVAC
jgi:hypothetical protein